MEVWKIIFLSKWAISRLWIFQGVDVGVLYKHFERFAFSMQGIELLRILNQGDVPIWSVSRDWRQKLDRQIDCEYGKDLFAKMFVRKYSINKHVYSCIGFW